MPPNWQPLRRTDTVHTLTGKPASDPSAHEVWGNDRYLVHLRRLEPIAEGAPPMVHLSIHDVERSVNRDYRDFMRIKNQLVGEHCWGYECLPDVDHEVDTSNQFHIWVIAEPGCHAPWGFFDGRIVMTPEQLAALNPGAVQRPFDYDEPGVDPDSPAWQAALEKLHKP